MTVRGLLGPGEPGLPGDRGVDPLLRKRRRRRFRACASPRCPQMISRPPLAGRRGRSPDRSFLLGHGLALEIGDVRMSLSATMPSPPRTLDREQITIARSSLRWRSTVSTVASRRPDCRRQAPRHPCSSIIDQLDLDPLLLEEALLLRDVERPEPTQVEAPSLSGSAAALPVIIRPNTMLPTMKRQRVNMSTTSPAARQRGRQSRRRADGRAGLVMRIVQEPKWLAQFALARQFREVQSSC